MAENATPTEQPTIYASDADALMRRWWRIADALEASDDHEMAGVAYGLRRAALTLSELIDATGMG